jgi:hypothetical protein
MKSIRVHYELVDLPLDSPTLSYLGNTVIAAAKRWLESALNVDRVV